MRETTFTNGGRSVRTVSPGELLEEWSRGAEQPTAAMRAGGPRFRSIRRSSRKLAVLVAMAALMASVTGTLAVHNAGFFEVDGNAVDGGPLAGDDWNTLIGNPCDSTPVGSATVKIITCVPDAAPETAFQGGGSKDDNDINQWKWADAPSGVSPGKDDIQNAYAALYTDASGNRFVYFGMDVLPSTGTRQVGFWFLQDPNFGVAANNTFSGLHQNNDVLVQSNFTQGGQLTNLSVFKWFNGSLVNLSSTTPGANFGCDPTDTVCVAVNAVPTTLSWRTGAQEVGDFFEGGIKLDGPPINFSATACLANFVGETRSSAPFSARLKDFATGDFNTCAKPTSIVTSQSSTGVTSGANITVTIGATVTDSATLSGANVATAGGTVTYTLYSENTCAAANSVFNGGTKTVVAGAVPNSDPYTTNTVGTFYWKATYSGDPNNEPSASACTAEVLTVNKASPTLPTTPSAGGPIGTILNDSATVTGGYNPTGSVTFNLWGPDDAGCDGTAVFTETKTLSGGSASTTTGYTTQAAGTFAWTASYSGDTNNNTASSGCTAEEVIIAKNSPTAATAQNLIPNDKLTLTGATSNAGGDVDFYLFAPGVTCSSANIANAAFKQENVALTGNIQAVTSNTGSGAGMYLATAVGTYHWLAIYSGDTNNNSATSNCVETFSIANTSP